MVAVLATAVRYTLLVVPCGRDFKPQLLGTLYW